MDYRALASQFGGQIVNEDKDKEKDYLELAKQFGGDVTPITSKNDQGEVDYLTLAKQFGGAGEPAPEAPPEQEVKGVKEKTKKGESVLAGTTLSEGVEPTKPETVKLPGFEHLYPSEASPFDQSEQARTEKLIMQGLDPEFARATARRNIAEQKPTTGAEYGIARPLTEAEAAGEEARQGYAPGTTSALSRIGGRSKEQYKAAIYGGLTFIGDMAEELGADEFGQRLSAGAAEGQKQSAAILKGIGENPDAVLNFLETGVSGAINTALPFLAGPTAGLATIGTQVFGQEYGEGREKGLDKADASMRAATMTSAELIGEAISLPFPMVKAFRDLAKGLPVDEIMPAFARLLVKENLAEQVTTALQFSADKFAPFGIRPDATLTDYLQAVKDTFYQTMAQTLVLGGTGAVVGKADQLLGPKPKEEEEQQKTAAELTKEKGFTFEQAKTEAPVTPPAEKAEPRAPTMENMREDFDALIARAKQKFAGFTGKDASAEEIDPVQAQFKDTVARYQDMGMTREQARQLATQDFEEAGYGDRLDTGTVQSGVSVPSEQRGADTGTPAPIGTGVGRDSETAVLPSSGAEAQPSALEAPQNLIDLRKQMVAADELAARSKYGPDKRNATMASRRYLTAMAEAAGTKETTSPEWQALNDAVVQQSEATPVMEEVEEITAPTPAAVEETVTPIAPVKQGKPRGRKKLDLTPEEALAKKQAKAVQTKEWKATNKELLDAQNVLNLEAPIREDFQDQDSYLDASMRYRAERSQALDLLNGMATGARRNTALGKTAQAGLTNPSITPQELAAVKERESLRKGTSRAELIEATDGVENDKYADFSTGGQALSWIAKNGNEFESTLAKRILPFVRNMKVVIVRSPADLPTNYLRKKFEGAAGMYSNGVIYLDANGGMNNTVFLHEALHGATIDRINKYIDDIDAGIEPEANLAEAVEEMNAVMKSAGRLYVALNQLGMTDARTDALARAEAFTDIKEFVAYGMSNPAMQEFLLQAPGMMNPTATYFDGLYNRFVQTIRKLFNMGPKHSSAMQDLIIVTDKLLAVQMGGLKVTREEAAPAKKQTQKFDVDKEKVRLSKAADTPASLLKAMQEGYDNHTVNPITRLLNARYESLGDNFIKTLLFAYPTDAMLAWRGNKIPGLVEADKLMQEMGAMRARMEASSAEKAEKLAAFIRKNGSVELSDTMHLARLKKVSPTEHATAADAIKADPIIQQYERLNADPATDPADISSNKGMITRRTNQINAVYDAWDALGKQKGGHEMYKMVRQFYQDAYNTTRTMLNAQIDALPIDAAAKAKLLKSVRLMHEKSVGSASETVLDEDGTPFVEVSFKNLPEDYFPFKRYGEYWLRIAEGPTGREFYLFESATARNDYRDRRAEELGLDLDDPKIAQGNSISSLRKDFKIEGTMLQEMFANIDQAKGDGRFDPAKFASAADPATAAKEALDAYKEELKDQLYQTYLMTMPERSFRKQFIHAEKITGFSSDILRNFKTSATAYASQLSKLNYANDINNSIQRARDSLEGMPARERGRLELFINEMDIRAQEEINPPENNQLATRINQFAFIMLLTSASSAAVQLVSVPIMVLNTLAPKYGYGKATVEFTKMMNILKTVGVTKTDADSGDVTYTAPSIASSAMARKDPNLNRAFQEAIEKYNLFSLTNTAMITNSAKTPDSAYANIPQTAARVSFQGISALFSAAERMSKEISFAMTFNLHFKKTGNFEESVQTAVQVTQEALFRYDTGNRPRILKNFLGQTVGQFKMFPILMTSWLVQNGHAIFNGSLPKEARVEAMQRLSGVLITAGMFHGLYGTPLVSLVFGTIDAALAALAMVDDEDEKERIAKNPLTAHSSYLRFKYDWLPKNFGEPTIPGLDNRMHSLAEVIERGPISALTDINFSSRTDLSSLWWRESKPGKDWVESAKNIAVDNLGPGVSAIGNMVGGVYDLSQGKFQSGLEKMVPALFKGSLVAYRLDEEGAKNKAGAKLLEKNEVNTLNIIAQVTGFQSTRLARIQEMNFAITKELKEAGNQRTKVLKEFSEAILADKVNPKDVKKAIDNIVKFNKRYPMEEFIIPPDTILNSVEARAEKLGMTIRGQYITEKLAPYVFPAVQSVTPAK